MKQRLLICLLLFFSFRAFSQCTLTVSVTSSSPTICSGNSVTLTATASQGKPPYKYIWNTGETTSSISANKGGTYTVTVTDNSTGCAPVKQSITVSAVTTPSPPTSKNVTVCPNTSAQLTVVNPVADDNSYQWYGSATGNDFLTSGITYNTQPITANSTFYVQVTVNSCTSTRTPVLVSLPSRPTVQGDTVCQGHMATLTASGGTSYTWYDSFSGPNIVSTNPSYTTKPLTATTTFYVVVNLNGCSSARTPVTATVTAAPPTPTASNVTICSGTTAQLHASASTGEFDWYTTATGGTSLISSPDYTTPALTKTTTYYVQTSLNGCTSARVPVTVTVTPPPAAPVTQTVDVCYNSSAVISASKTPTGTYNWYDVPVGGTPFFSGNTYTTPVLTNSTSYFVEDVNGSCTSTRTQITVNVKPQVSAPSTSGAIICYGSSATLTTQDEGGTYQWFTAGGIQVGAGTSYTTPNITSSKTYFVQRTLNGCVSPKTAVTVTVEAQDPAPTAPGVTICSGNTATLTATSSDNIYAWYDAPSGGTLLSSAPVYVTPVLTATTTYYVQTTSSTGCTSPMKAVKVTVNPTPTQPTANGVTICPGTSAHLVASASSGTIQWFTSSTSVTPVKTGNTYDTPVLTTPTTYYVAATNGSCPSARTPVTVSMVSGTNPEFQYSSGTYCATGPNETPVINNPSGGTFSASPAGLVFVSNTTGEINVSASTPGTYTISFTNNAPCPGTTTTSISIVTTISSGFSYHTPFCQGGPNPSPVFSAGATAGSFSAMPAGLVFVNTSTGEIDLTQSTPGTYTITNSIPASSSCSASSSTTTVTIYPKVIVDAGPNQTLPTGTTAQLAGSITGGATTGTWSGGTGAFSNPSDPDATYTPGPGETTAVLTLTSSDPAGPCGPQSATVTLTFGSQPNAPTAANVTICTGNMANLAATAPGGTYRWYSNPSLSSAIFTGPAFTTPALTATTDYYVTATINGVTSNPTKVTVTVTSTNSTPTVTGDIVICQGTATTLTASGSTGSYRWYDSLTAGNLISDKPTYTTPVLNYNASYYVEAVSTNCQSARTEVDVTVTPKPNIISAATGVICSGNPLSYIIISDQPSATFLWSRAKVTGISNPAVSAQTTSTIDETLVNTTLNPIKVTYTITPLIGSCSGPVYQYVVTVYPTPKVTSAASATVCDETPVNYTVTFNDPSTKFSWGRAAVSGISNAAVSGQSVANIQEVPHNITNAPIQVTYVFNYQTSACSGPPFSYVVTVNPMAAISSDATGTACSGVPQDYAITSDIATATYNWSRAAVTGISNPAVTNKKSSTITEKLNNTTANPINVTYVITPTANSCMGTPFNYVVKVNPSVATPIVNSNSPVCTGATLSISTAAVIGATYQWTEPDGSIVPTTTPTLNIDNATTANSGTYTLVVLVKGCESKAVSVNAKVDDPTIADAGFNQTVCKFTPVVQLAGSISGGGTGVWEGGTGTFSTSREDPKAVYTSSAADVAQGFITLTLMTTSKDGCPASSSSMTITYGPAPGVDAGPDLSVCSQDASIPVTGRILTSGTVTWVSLGSGYFTDPSSLSTNYVPSKADVAAGSVQLVLELNGNDQCFFKTDTMTMRFIPPPTVYAGGIRYVLKGYPVTLTPTVNENNLKYLWTPDIDINDDTLKNPTVTGDISRTYTVTVTDPRGCTSSDTVYVEVSPPINIDNTFTPNGDGINDTWNITGLVAYVKATVDIYSRYGQPVFHSIGYPVPWDGTYNGKALPVGVYYYVIHLNFNDIVLSGPVTILR